MDLKKMSAGNIVKLDGGAEFTGNFETIVRANIRLGIAERVLLRLETFKARFFDELISQTEEIPFEKYISDNSVKIKVSATSAKSKIYHSKAAAERVELAIKNRIRKFGQKSTKTSSDIQNIFVRIEDDLCTISIDTSGDLLHKRGYKTATTDAPLRETVAFAALMFSDYTAKVPLIDPMCGSGTLLTEAFALNKRIAPGTNRKFAFDNWPVADKDIIKKERLRAKEYSIPFTGKIAGSDISDNSIEAASINFKNIGIENEILLSNKPVSSLTTDFVSPLIICNPPWGRRLNGENLKKLEAIYKDLGDFVNKTENSRLCLITTNQKLASATGIKFKQISPPIPLGGMRLKFYLS
jgi:putative N6-adenine-specific DNA methylase